MKEMRRDNHYVPRLYLKQWAREGKIPTYRLLVPSENYPLWKDQSLKGIAFHQHLYTYIKGHEETDEFERWLDREFEGPAEEAISRVVSDQKLTREQWRRLARFAVAQDVRTPARLREFLARQRQILPDLMNETVEDAISKLKEAETNGSRFPQTKTDNANTFPLKVLIERKEDGSGVLEARTAVGRRLWLWAVRHLLTSTIHRLPAHRWTILRAPTGISWPTTDSPVVRLNFFGTDNYNFGGGWGVKNGDILLPLSPKHLLYTCIGKRFPKQGATLDEQKARLMRKIIVEHGDRYVFARDKEGIELIRPRIVCPETYKRERVAWQNWHSEQTQAEIELLS